MRTSSSHSSELLRLFLPFWPWILLASVTGIVAGAVTVQLLASINEVLNRPGGLAGHQLLLFLGLCATVLVSRAVSDVATNLVGHRLVAEVRKSVAAKILAAPIDALERYRTHRLMPVLTRDIDRISDLAFVLATFLIAASITIGSLVYLALLSLPLFCLMVVMLAMGSAVQALCQTKGVEGFRKARDLEEVLHKAYRGISEGAKELRIHRERRVRMFGVEIERTIDSIRTVNGRATNTFVLGRSLGSALFFLLIAALLSWAAFWPVEPAVLSGFVLVLLFLKGPLDQIVGILPGVGQAKVAMMRVADLSASFTTPEPHLHLDRPGEKALLRDAIELRGVHYAFRAPDGGESFAIGPVDLRLRAGELVFIVGDNGSGKTTLIKLLLGLYEPQGGEVLLDGRKVVPESRDDYRQLFTTVFSDFYLFEDLVPGNDRGTIAALPETARPYLERLEIAHKVSLSGGSFNTLDLSTGQRKRLALVHAYLEGRPVLVFDEWAADQDPAFRHLFYTELLPEWRAKGHLLVVISHDDRYFHLADRVVRLAGGKVVDDRSARDPGEQAKAA